MSGYKTKKDGEKMKKLVLMSLLLLVLSMGVVSARTDFEFSNMKTVVYAPQSMFGSYQAGYWVQHTNDEMTSKSFLNTGYSHRTRDASKRIVDAIFVHKFLCETWRVNEKCQYTIDPRGQVRNVLPGHDNEEYTLIR